MDLGDFCKAVFEQDERDEGDLSYLFEFYRRAAVSLATAALHLEEQRNGFRDSYWSLVKIWDFDKKLIIKKMDDEVKAFIDQVDVKALTESL